MRIPSSRHTRSLAALLTSLGLSLAAWTAAKPADAFCGFYVSDADTKLYADATQVVLMREGTKTVLSMQNDYKGPPEKFAMVVPVPVVLSKESVKTLPMDVFDTIDKLGSPRLVEYWEQDPCPDPANGNMWGDGIGDAFGAGGLGLSGIGEGGGGAGLGVKIEAKFAIGEYEIVILSAKDASGLDTWLKQEKYNIPEGAEPYLKPYVQAGMKFFVAKVDIKKVKMENGHALLSPIRFHYDSEQFNLPIKLGLINSSGTQDLIVNILAKNQRYEVANYPNVTIPTNLDVTEAARSKFPDFYAALFDKTVEANYSKADKKNAVVTEYSWSSGSCDPCPGPTLSADDLATFGAEVLPNGLDGVTKSSPSGGIGLGNIGTFGRGSGAGAYKGKPPSLRMGTVQVNGRLPPEVISRIVRQNFGRFRLCYEQGLIKNPVLGGRVAVKFVIDRSGSVSVAQDGGSDLPDPSVVSCVVRSFSNLTFPQPEGGIVTAVFPIVFSPAEGATAASGAPKPPPPPPPPPPTVFNGASPYVMTRLHVRYSKDSMGEDLVFKKAGPIVGGREDRSGADGQLEKGSRASEQNNFQARYAVRHAWTGPIECKEPQRNRWGAKPRPRAVDGGVAPPEVEDREAIKGVLGAPKLAFAPRGNVALGAMLTPNGIADVTKAGVSVGPIPQGGPDGGAADSLDGGDATDGGAGTAKKRGCGACAIANGNEGAASLGFAGLILGVLGVRRRRPYS